MFAGDLPSGPVVKSHASTAQVWSLVRELRFCMHKACTSSLHKAQ